MRRLSRLVLASTIAAITATGCQDAQGPGGRGRDTTDTPPPVLLTLIVSNPTLSALTDPAASLNGSAAPGDVYVSLPPGSFPGGDSMIIRTRRTGLLAMAAMVDGGIDPVAVAAEAGDTLDVLVYLDDDDVRRFISLVPLHRPPVIVRTDPPPARRDVPLNAVMILVFSEPIKATALTNGSVVLFQSGVPVAGTLAFVDPANLTVMFTPAAPLAPGSAYSLVVTQGIEDLSGDALAAPVTVGFVTQTALLPVDGAYERVTPHSWAGYHSRYVLRGDGTFELQYETVTRGNFAYTGRYWRTSVGIIFHFDDSNTAGPWTATAQLSGDSLTVAFNVVMQLADFEDGVYVQAVDAPTGTVEITTTTSGSLPDPDGYSGRLQAGSSIISVLVPANGMASIAVAPGSYTVSLQGVAGNCSATVAGGSTHQVDVVAEATVAVAFTVTCDSSSQLAFVRNGQIYLVNPDGTGLVQLTNGPGDGDPAWSPDGQRIAFTRTSGRQLPCCTAAPDIYVMDADGSNLVQRTHSGYNESPTWSPDGTQIAFAALGGGSMNVYVMSAVDDGSGATLVVSRPGYDGHPAWSPDGSGIAFVSDWTAYDFTMDIYVSSPDGAQISQSTNGFGFGGSLIQYYQPAWSPDGQQFAAVSCLIAFYTCDTSTVLVMNRDGSGMVPLAVTSGWARPTWSPDGQTIAFGASGSIAWVSVDGSTQGVIVTNGHSPAWRP